MLMYGRDLPEQSNAQILKDLFSMMCLNMMMPSIQQQQNASMPSSVKSSMGHQ
jgi:hypothetical protein